MVLVDCSLSPVLNQAEAGNAAVGDTYIFRTTASETAADHLEHVQARGCDHEAVRVEGDLYALIECDRCALSAELAAA